MVKINFTKMVASGNDFIVIESGHKPQATSHKFLARDICERKYGVGADGLLILEKAKIADIKMRIFNADGSEAEMCGNGARCVAYKLQTQNSELQTINIETKAGIIESQVKGKNVKIKLTEPRHIKLDIPIKINNHLLRVNFINTGVPHAVIFVEGLNKIDVMNIGRQIRYHTTFSPRGTNVDFVEVLNNNSIKVRTYERGVEDETLACGTGVVASALLTSFKPQASSPKIKKINVLTKSGEVLKVYFNSDNKRINNVWLEGKVKIICKGEYYV